MKRGVDGAEIAKDTKREYVGGYVKIFGVKISGIWAFHGGISSKAFREFW